MPITLFAYARPSFVGNPVGAPLGPLGLLPRSPSYKVVLKRRAASAAISRSEQFAKNNDFRIRLHHFAAFVQLTAHECANG
jgi:hypothetical protein